MTPYRDRLTNGDYNPKDAKVTLDGTQIAKVTARSRKRTKNAAKKK